MTFSRALELLHKGLWVAAAVSSGICIITLGGLVGAPILAPELVDLASVILLATIPAALILSAVRAERGKRPWAIARAVLLPPLLLVALIVWAFVSLPGVVNRVALPDGRRLLLGISPHPSDVIYELWQSVDPWGVLWRPTNSDLSWSEDGAHTADPALVVDPKGRWLLVRRGGLWTDCLDLHANLRGCESRTEASPEEDPEAWEKRSCRIERLVGLPPIAAR